MEHTDHKRLIVLAALMPVFTHIGLLLYSITRYGYSPSSRLDFLVTAIAFIYLMAVLIFINKTKRLLRLVLITYSFIISLLTIEFTYRVFHKKVNAPWEQGRIIMAVASSLMPGVDSEAVVNINKYGLRGPNLDFKDADINIGVIGGSSAECHYISDELSWPWKVQDYLGDKLEKKVFVCNSGKGGAHTLNHIYFLEHYPWIDEFDCLIVLCGINDVGRLLHGNYDERTVFTFDDKLVDIKHIYAVYYKRSLLVQNLIFLYKNKITQEIVVRDPAGRWYITARESRRLLLKRNPIDEVPKEINEAIGIYKDDLRKIISLCKQRGQDLFMLTQPTIYRQGLTPEVEALLWEYVGTRCAYTTDVLEKVSNIYNEAMIKVCAEEGIPCLDIASMLPKDTTIFYDDCHFNISGCERVAEIVSEYIYNYYASKRQ